MQLYTIDSKPYKNLFFQSAVPMWVMVVGSFFIVNNGYFALPNFDPRHQYTWIILLAMVLLAFAYAWYRKQRLTLVHNETSFEAQIKHYEKIYRLTMSWYLFSCIVSILLYLLTTRTMFLLFALFDVVMWLPYYPVATLFRKELRNDEIILQ